LTTLKRGSCVFVGDSGSGLVATPKVRFGSKADIRARKKVDAIRQSAMYFDMTLKLVEDLRRQYIRAQRGRD